MADTREKLIELLEKLEKEGALVTMGNGYVANLMIANGVTLATDNNVGGKWIPVTERLPEKCEPVLACFDFMGGKAVKASDRYGKNGLLWSGIPCGGKVTHWMPLPSTEGLE